MVVEKGIRGRICHVLHRHAKAHNKHMNNLDKNITSSYLMHLDANNLYGWAVSQKLPVNGFECVEELSQFNKDFIKDYDENSDNDFWVFIMIYHFYLKEIKLRKCNNLACHVHDKENYVVHINL